MDKKAKKRTEVLMKRREKLRQQLAVVRKFTDDPAELAKLEQDVADLTAELEQLAKS